MLSVPPIPGECVCVEAGPARHVGIVTDAIGRDGQLRVIHNSLRRRGVYEEDWPDFADGRDVSHCNLAPVLPVPEVLRRARAEVGRSYDPLRFNCEHFVAHAYGLPVRSPQARRAGLLAGAAVSVIGSVAAYLGRRT